VKARVDVKFQGVPGVKRVVLQGNLNQQQVSTATNFQLTTPRAPSDPFVGASSASEFGFSVVLLLVIAFLKMM